MSKKHYSDLGKTAWQRISEEYNNSATISTKRSVQQLKKMWCNMKCTQRDNLTKEKQARFATGGGPPPPVAEVDPTIAEIIPSLMKTVPIVFSSNIPIEILQEREVAIIFDEDASIGDLINEENVEALVMDEALELGNIQSNLENIEKVSSKETRIIDDIAPRKRRKRSNEITDNIDEKELKLERIHYIIKEEQELATLRKEHEKEKRKVELEYLKERHRIEIEILSEKLNHEREKQELEMQYWKVQYELQDTSE